MPRRLTRRLTTTFLVALSLLFAQLALAAYACPGQTDGATMAAMMAAGVPCDGMDDQQPVLCHQHAADAGKTFEAAKVPAPTLPLVVLMLELPVLLDDAAAGAMPCAVPAQTHPPPDPLYLATLRLRV